MKDSNRVNICVCCPFTRYNSELYCLVRILHSYCFCANVFATYGKTLQTARDLLKVYTYNLCEEIDDPIFELTLEEKVFANSVIRVYFLPIKYIPPKKLHRKMHEYRNNEDYRHSPYFHETCRTIQYQWLPFRTLLRGGGKRFSNLSLNELFPNCFAAGGYLPYEPFKHLLETNEFQNILLSI